MKQRVLTLHSLLTRLIWLCVLPLVLLAIYLAGVHVHMLQTGFDNEASDRAYNLATALDNDLISRISALQALSASPLIDDPPRLKEFYNEAQGFRESFSGHIVFADTSMQMIFNTRVPFGDVLPKLPQPKGHAAAPYVLSTGKPSVGDMFFGPIAKEPLVAIVVPVIRNGKTKGLLLSIIETRQFQQRIDKLALPSEWRLALLDGKGDVMARRRGISSEGGQFDEISSKRFTAKLTASYWSVVLEIPVSVYRTPIMSATAAFIAAIFAITFVSILAGRLAGRRLTKSIMTLTKTPLTEPLYPPIAEIEEVRTLLNEAAEAQDAADKALRESEDKFRHVFESANVGKSITLPTGEINVNKAFADMLGYTRDELRNKRWQDLTPSDEIEAIQKILTPLLNGEKDSARFEKRYIDKNGSHIWADVSVAVQRDSDGKPLYFITTIVDITERKKAEESLKDRERQLSIIADNLPGLVSRMDRSHRYLFASKGYELVFGFEPEVIIGRTMAEVIGDEAFKRAEPYVKRVLAGEQVSFENPVNLPNGEIGYGLVTYVPDFAVDGKVQGFFTLGIDITERKKAEEELKMTNEELLAINKIITTTTTTTGVKEILEKVLDAALNITGIEGGTICMITPDETLHLAVHRETSDATILDLTTNEIIVGDCLCGECARDHKSLILKNREEVLKFSTREAIRGEDIRFHAAYPLLIGERCLGVLCVFTRTDKKPADRRLKLLETVTSQIAIAVDNAQMFEEISHHAATLEDKVKKRTAQLKESQTSLMNMVDDLSRKTEELRVANERLKELDRLKSMFIASMSHELRTPLNSIIGFSSILLDEWTGPLNDEQKQNLAIVLRSGKHLLALINDVIDVSKIEAGTIDINVKDFDLYDVIKETLSSFEKEIKDKVLELEVESIHQMMHTDRRRLIQCITNLVSNAIKFTEKGLVCVQARMIADFGLRISDSELAAKKSTIRNLQSAIEISVSDTGIGIKDEDIARLFQPFIRLESPLKAAVPGTGLGLYLTKKLVTEALKGDIMVESTFGKGSRFVMRMPVNIGSSSKGQG